MDDVVDMMIEDNYVLPVRGVGNGILLKTAEAMDMWIEESAGSIEERHLLRSFDRLRDQYVTGLIPEPQPRGRDYPDLPDVSGEIDYGPWSGIGRWPSSVSEFEPLDPCRECGHDRLFHDMESFGDNCYHGYSRDGGMPCNCGNHMGR